MKRVFALVAAVIVLTTAFTIAGKRHKKIENGNGSEIKSVYVVKPLSEDMTESIELTGSIVPQSEVTVAAETAGKVIYRVGNEGTKVSAGQVLLKIDDSALQAQLSTAVAAVSVAEARLAALRSGARSQERLQAENSVRQAQAAFDNARQNYERIKALYSQGAIAEQQLDAVKAQYLAAEAQLSSAKAQLSMVGEGARREDVRAAEAGVSQARGNVDMIRVQLGHTVLRAPVSGVVSDCKIDKGEMVLPGTPLMRITEQNNLYFEARVPERLFAKLNRGQAADITVDALPGKVIAGKVTELVPVADARTRSFKVRISLQNGNVKSGMFARAKVAVSTHRATINVPCDAVRESDGRKYITCVENGKVKKMEVRTGIEQENRIEVMGVSTETSIVVVGQDDLVEGQKVKVMEGAAF
ncbi:MAG: efflux RND transporter periplasmic adaptor subunit [bacterium]|jgi:HlyD family secretion protein|nr:efflux RND transporter periplasmic adaptor subunit [bacterium]MDD3805496.1 efflux RND transporter periplasmic adaptor subunit [bacterium]